MLEERLNSCDALLSFEIAAEKSSVFSKLELCRLVDEDSMMRVNVCMMQMHWKGPMESLSAKRTLEAYALWDIVKSKLVLFVALLLSAYKYYNGVNQW